MLVVAAAALILSVPLPATDPPGLVPGDGVALDPVARVISQVDLPERDGGDPRSPSPLGLGALAGIGVAGSVVASTRRRRRSMDPVYVLVHGNGGSAADFDVLLSDLGVDASDTVAFDWGTVPPYGTSTEASKVASTERAAVALDELIREMSLDHGNIYSIHHSKGGSAGVAMIAALDDGTRPPIDGYRGAALLDPAIASGTVGSFQRFGSWTPFLPDNGGFDPMRCTQDGCRDVRAHLGEASGVEVIAIRNPDAVLTNFEDQPEGLRVYDLVEDGGPSALVYWPWLPVVVARTHQAHGSVLEHWAVVDCIKAEVASPGSCVWKGDAWRPRIAWGRGNGKNLAR